MKLRDFLQSKGMKINFLAAEIGVNQSLVCAWLNGAVVPTLKHIVKIEEITKGKVRARDLIVENTRKKRQSKNKEQKIEENTNETIDPEKFLEKLFS